MIRTKKERSNLEQQAIKSELEMFNKNRLKKWQQIRCMKNVGG